GRTLDSPMLVANKLTEDKFKDVAYINGDENRVSFAMALSFNRKLEEFAKASANVAAATAYGDAILNDLAVEQIFARTPGNKQDLPLLGRLVEHGLINPIAASDDANLALPDVKLVLELLARVEFLADSQVSLMHGGLNPFQTDHEVTKATHKLIEQFLAKTFTATDGWFDAKAKKTAYKKVTSALEKRVEELKTDADKLGDLFRDQDKSRYFTFPRAWSGDYYRQAAFSVLVRPVFNRTYTHKMEVFNAVLEKERQALPAFN
ncbi:MAG: hypothetical protein HY075_02575, partial [Deltaproteobacteria bacterium]|nr:hypothetical protein [Deltaproteobacteria bacterium]